MDDEANQALGKGTDGNPAVFVVGRMLVVVEGEDVRVLEDGNDIIEEKAMFFLVGYIFGKIPLETHLKNSWEAAAVGRL